MKKGVILWVLLGLTVPGLKADNAFPFEFFEKMQQATNENIVVSPFSMEQAIGMAANGALDATLPPLLDLTGDESLAALNQRNQVMAELLTRYQDDTLTSILVANSVWHMPNLSLLEPFRDSVVTRYNAYIDTADFATQNGVDAVDKWVSDNTKELIPYIYGKPNPNIIVSLINATLFRGTWDWDLNVELAAKEPFLNADGTGTNVDMVSIFPHNQSRLYMDEDLVAFDASFMESDYSNGYHALFILPRDYDRMVPLTAERWSNLLMHKYNQGVRVRIPKFDVACREEMLPTLMEMGAFIPNDFGGVAPAAYVQSIIHSTRMTLDENGMSAAAVTAITMYAIGMPYDGPRVDLVFNRPFYVAIMAYGSDEPIFLAKITNLEGSACEAPTPNHISLGIDNQQESVTPTKYLRDGQLLIQAQQGIYTATGQKIQ